MYAVLICGGLGVIGVLVLALALCRAAGCADNARGYK